MSSSTELPMPQDFIKKTVGPRKVLWGALVATAILAAAGFAWWGKASPTSEKVVARDVPRLESGQIRFSPQFAERVGLSFTQAKLQTLAPSVSVTGTVAFDASLYAAVGARISGRVRHIYKFAGDEVKVGEVVGELESAELAQAQAALLAAKANAEAAAAQELRELQLAEARVSSQRDAEVAKAAATAARAEMRAAEQRLKALGGEPHGPVGVFFVRSPIAGKVIEAQVLRGQSVDSTQTLFRIADLRRLWVELAVFERDLGYLQSGNAVEISPLADPQRVLVGSVSHVGDVIDEDTRSAAVRVVVPNDTGLLRPGQAVMAKIKSAGKATEAIVLPREAVTTVDGTPTVFVAQGENAVVPRSITLGAHDGTQVEVVRGLEVGERVAVHGVFALKSEIFR